MFLLAQIRADDPRHHLAEPVRVDEVELVQVVSLVVVVEQCPHVSQEHGGRPQLCLSVDPQVHLLNQVLELLLVHDRLLLVPANVVPQHLELSVQLVVAVRDLLSHDQLLVVLVLCGVLVDGLPQESYVLQWRLQSNGDNLGDDKLLVALR